MASHPRSTHEDARAAPRRHVRLRALIREPGSSRIDIDLVDLSATGFAFESFHSFASGTRVFLTIPTLSPIEATVVWRASTRYGCRFVQPMHVAVFETIADRFG